MVLIIIYAQVLLLCARGTEPKIVYARPQRNNTAVTTTTTARPPTAEIDDEETATATAAMAAVATVVNATMATSVSSTGHRYADNAGSMSSKTDVYGGVQFFAPPVIHGGTVDAYGRPLHRLHHPLYHHGRHPQQQYHQLHHHHRLPQDGNGDIGDGTSAGPTPILMNPLQVAAYEDPSTARYSPPSRPQQRHRVQVKYAEPAVATLAYQLPFLAAETDDTALLDNLPALQFALQHAAGKLHPSPAANPASGLQPHYVLQPHQQHHVVKQPASALHQLYTQQPLQRTPPHHRYATYGGTGTGGGFRYTQVPFVYNLPAPPPAQRHHQQLVTPGEYDLVTRFNQLLNRQRERDDNNRKRRPVVAVDDDEDEETATRPAVKPKKYKKKKKKKRKKKQQQQQQQQQQPKATSPPAPVDEEHDDYTDDRPQQEQEDDNTAHTSEEQESQNVLTSEKLPQSTDIHETEANFENDEDEPTKLSQQFGGDLTFEDGNGERVEFQLHGLGGPDSYKFGFDTGKGTNRQFRYEERDSSGYVHGHYGYLDHDGKMQVYNYSSHPELGFHSQKSESIEM